MPTIKQKKAFKEVLKGSTLTKAMTTAGYADTTASTTGKLTSTEGWKELMEKHLPDSELARVHKEGLNASDKIIRDGEVILEKPDYAVRHKYLDSAYKLKGSYAPEKTQALNLNIKGDIKDFNELDAIRIKYEEELKKTLNEA